MPAPDFVIRQGDTASSIFDTLRDADGDPVDIAGASIRFDLIPLAGGSAIVSGGTATNLQSGDGSDGSKGDVEYPWVAGQTDTDAWGLGVWRVTFTDASVQTFPNDGYILVQISPDAPTSLDRAYVSLEELKAVSELTGFNFADVKIDRARKAASRAVDEVTGRRFWLDADNTSTRRYSPDSATLLPIDDIVDVQAVAIDRNADGVFEETWTSGTHYVLEPLNAADDSRPFEWIRVRSGSGRSFPCGLEASVRVTGQFGWDAVPDEVVEATKLLTIKLVRRSETPFGVVSFGTDSVAAVRIARTDPDVANLLEGLIRRRPFF